MVSQPDRTNTLTVRGSSSVVETSSRNHSHHNHHQHHHSSRPALSSRSKRYNRSHAGGAAYIPQNEFPVFSHSGDVEILIKAGAHETAVNRYLLHRHTLTRCSGFFEASTSREWSKAKTMPLLAEGTELARIGEDDVAADGGATPGANTSSRLGVPRKRWRYELDPGTHDGDVPMLVQKEESSPGTAPTGSLFAGPNLSSAALPSSREKSSRSHPHSLTSSNRFFQSVANLAAPASHTTPAPPQLSQADTDLLRDYDNLFRIMYNYPPVLDGINIADAYVQCKSLLTLADQYDALEVVGPRVDHHLLQFQSRLWKQIAKYPISYLRLGYLARSKVIFQEALIHVVGQWPAGERSLRAALPDCVLDIIEDKVDEMEETIARTEGRLFRLNLLTARGERVSPATSYLDWLAVSLFRQWLADNTNPAAPALPPPSSSRPSRSAPPPPPQQQQAVVSVGRTYRTIGNGGAYLGHDECKRFLKLTPDLYSRDNLRRFEKRVDELKGMARDVVRPLMGSGLELEMGGASGRADGIGYLTCTSVGDRDLPWPVVD